MHRTSEYAVDAQGRPMLPKPRQRPADRGAAMAAERRPAMPSGISGRSGCLIDMLGLARLRLHDLTVPIFTCRAAFPQSWPWVLTDHGGMALLVEIHVPMPTSEEVDIREKEHPAGWIEEIDDFLAERHGNELEVFDEGEQHGDVYVFFIAGANERTLLRVASRVALLEGVPGGSFAMVTDDAAEELGSGRRVDLPMA